MNWKEFAADHLSFTRKERIGVIVIILIVLSIFFLPKALSYNNTKVAKVDSSWVASIKKLEQKETENNNQNFGQYNDNNSSSYQYDRNTNNYYAKSKGELFYFDPNTATSNGITIIFLVHSHCSALSTIAMTELVLEPFQVFRLT